MSKKVIEAELVMSTNPPFCVQGYITHIEQGAPGIDGSVKRITLTLEATEVGKITLEDGATLFRPMEKSVILRGNREELERALDFGEG